MIATEHVKIGELVMDDDEIVGVCVKECEAGEKIEVRDDIETIMEAMQRKDAPSSIHVVFSDTGLSIEDEAHLLLKLRHIAQTYIGKQVNVFGHYPDSGGR